MTSRRETGGNGGNARSGGNRRAAAGPRRISPGAIFLAVALIGSLLFFVYAVTVRDPSQIPLLAAGAAALGIAFLALAAYSLRLTWRAGVDGRDARAVGFGLGGGIAAIIGAGCLSWAIILFMLSQTPAAS